MTRRGRNLGRAAGAGGLALAGLVALHADPAPAQQAAYPGQQNAAPQNAAPELSPALPTGTDIPGQIILPPGGGPPPEFAPSNPDEIKGFQLQTSLAVQEILTDNARGAASGGTLNSSSTGVVTVNPSQKKTADLITRITPSFTALDRTPRLQFGLNYQPSYQKFINASDQDRFDNQLTATGFAELWKEHLTLNASSSVSRQFISNQGALTPLDRSTDNNQTTVETYTISPTLTQHFGSFATGQLQYLYGSTSSGVIAPAQQNTVNAGLTSGTDFGPLFWQATLLDSETDQGSTPNPGQVINNVVTPTINGSTSQQTAQISTAYALNHTVSLLSGFGYESIDSGDLGSKIRGPFGDFGIGLTGSRASLTLLYNFRYGDQYVSTTGSFDITPRLRVQGSYNESVTTTQNQLINQTAGLGLTPTGSFVNTATQQAFSPVNSAFGINSGLGNLTFHQKLGQLSLTGLYGLNSYALQLQHETRTASVAGFDETDISVAGTYNRTVSPLTNFMLSLGLTSIDQSAPTNENDQTYSATTGIDYKLTETVTANVSYSFIYRNSSLPGQSVIVNELLLGLRKTF